ncbi:unnamed protein product [Cuscuta epithymum]|uniref:Uncharacterized protein n=1 Tax=Cuscuta epithymum TaxID=186058 RepID=A0AAV0CWW9_9ASTE|nr:unnamed protein product [Cuscuta epithymum]CAH9085628.1 unnamed protein product [Cuscuta epithymum]CAH9116976.1 unnamed protein product [Cuscuta epithymum]CAH9140461.1 unnamed protein product [Cuscuta epithymum]CAH9140476.1 unnamed protein product [Cuscuta epithymum]
MSMLTKRTGSLKHFAICMRHWPSPRVSSLFVNTDKMRGRHHTISATHVDMDQNTRDIIMREFWSGSSRVRITTDLKMVQFYFLKLLLILSSCTVSFQVNCGFLVFEFVFFI